MSQSPGLQDTAPMKLFRLPNGLEVWNGMESEADTHFLYREMFEQHHYERHGVALKPGDVIFDVGANIGMFALSLMERFCDLRLYCFEPVPSTYACLTRNLTDSPRRTSHRFDILNIGLGVTNGKSTIEFFPGAPSNSTLYSADKHRDFGRVLDGVRFADIWRTNKLRALLMLPIFPFRKRLLGAAFERIMAGGVSMQCDIRPLSAIVDEYQVERIDLLKIDVEGSEMDVLMGIRDEHWSLIRQLAMEVDPSNKHLVSTLVERLRSLGFSRITVESMFGGPFVPEDPVACTIFAVRSHGS